jgi:hypothetical protein
MRKVRYWLLYRGPSIVQLILSIHALGMAYILSSGSTVFAESRSYTWMAQHGTEVQWASRCFIAGIVGLLGLFSIRPLQIFAAFASALFIGLVTWGYKLSNPDGVGWWTYMILMSLSYWVMFVRINENVGSSKYAPSTVGARTKA